MSDRKLAHRSFAGGEITGELYGRLDLTKYQTGVALCRNFLVLPHGPLQNRSGFSYVIEAGDVANQVRIISFAFSADQSMVLEFGHQYIRFHTGGGTLLETSKNIVGATQAPPGVLNIVGHAYLAGDVVFVNGVVGMTQLNGRYFKVVVVDVNNISLTLHDGTAVSTAAYGAYVSGGTIGRVYQITSPYSAADLFDIHFAQDSDVLTATSKLYPAQELKRLGAASWTITPVTFVPTMAPPGGFSVVATKPTPNNTTLQAYVVTAIAADGVTETLASNMYNGDNNLTIAGNYNTLYWTLVPGAVRYNAYKRHGGAFCYMGRTASNSLVDNNVLPDITKTPPEDIIQLNVGVGEYPQAITYHEQRRWFAGTANDPQTCYATRNGAPSNLTSSVPSQADDGMRFRIAAQQQNAVRHLVPLSDLIALTAGGVFRLFADGAPSITPDALSVKPQGYSGAANVQPVLTSGSILYVQAEGSHLRELSFSPAVGGGSRSSYLSVDMSVMSPHLVDGFRLTDVAFSTAPLPSVWAARSDGVLLGMTYLPEHQVAAWHQHDTDGFVESVACVAENNESVLYAVIKRTINGRVVRYIERMATRFYKNSPKADAFIVDCGLQYSGAPITTLGNLHHLEGKTVSILADGAVQTRQVVADGKVVLTVPASKISVGLPIEADIETLPVAVEGMDAAGQGTRKNVGKVYLRVFRTTGLKIGPDADHLTPQRSRSNEPYGESPRLRTEELDIGITPKWSSEGSVFLRQSDPVPTMILSMALGVTTGG